MLKSELIRRVTKRLYDQDKKHTDAEISRRIAELNNAAVTQRSRERKQKIIVSLTSFPTRYDGLYLVIKSLLTQTVLPDRIILYYDETDAVTPFPSSLTALFGDVFSAVRRDTPRASVPLKPHKKYFYAMQEYPDDIIITVDDDVIYPPDLIEKLLSAHRRFPDCVTASRAHLIRFENGKVAPYDRFGWCLTRENKPSMLYIPTGVGGVLYPPKCLDERVFDLERINRLCPCADDLWLKFMALLKGTPTVVCDRSAAKRIISIPDSQTVSLEKQNVHAFKNDECIKKLSEEFSVTEESFRRCSR